MRFDHLPTADDGAPPFDRNRAFHVWGVFDRLPAAGQRPGWLHSLLTAFLADEGRVYASWAKADKLMRRHEKPQAHDHSVGKILRTPGILNAANVYKDAIYACATSCGEARARALDVLDYIQQNGAPASPPPVPGQTWALLANELVNGLTHLKAFYDGRSNKVSAWAHSLPNSDAYFQNSPKTATAKIAVPFRWLKGRQVARAALGNQHAWDLADRSVQGGWVGFGPEDG